MPLSTSLPPELLLEVLTLLHIDYNPLDILLVSSSFYHLFSELLYGHLTFRRINQLTRFVETFSSTVSIPRPIRNITVDVDNGLRLGLYAHIQALFSLCATAPEAEIDEHARLVLESVNFRFHTHSQGDDLFVIYEALVLVNPHSFTWVGPDPPHHFSAAIVPSALSYVLRALATHTKLNHLTLSHVKFPDNSEILPLPNFPSLKSLTLSQVIFLRPDTVAEYVLTSGSQLQCVKLIDAYQHSIWGPRLRRSHVEDAATRHTLLENYDDDGAPHADQANSEAVLKIQRIVLCQGKFERIIGGDRVIKDSILI